jgi:predicted peptidase
LLISSSALSQSQTTEEFSVKLEKNLKFLLYLPDGYESNADQKWPLLLFLHGAGERGDNLAKVKIHGPPKQAAAGRKFPFILVSPQCPSGQWWEPDVLMALIEDLEKSHRIDTNRIYATGLSMGGYGTWALAMRYPDKFAAIAPICGGGIPYRTRFITNLPIWTFHGDADNAVHISQTRALVDELKKRGSNVKFTIYPGVGHNSWDPAYNEPEFYIWLLKQNRRPGKAPE